MKRLALSALFALAFASPALGATENTLIAATAGSFMPVSGTPAPALPAERNDKLLVEFDPATDQCAVWSLWMPDHYNGGGVTVTGAWTVNGADVTTNAVWFVNFMALADDAASSDIDSDSYAADQSVTAAAPSAQGEIVYFAINVADGTAMDSVAKNEAFFLRICRDADNGSDDVDATQLLSFDITEQ